jgi:hypothetical protein
MMYTYRVEVSMTATVEVEAESYDEATQLAGDSLNLESIQDRVGFPETDGVVVDNIESDDDPEDIN